MDNTRWETSLLCYNFEE